MYDKVVYNVEKSYVLTDDTWNCLFFNIEKYSQEILIDQNKLRPELSYALEQYNFQYALIVVKQQVNKIETLSQDVELAMKRAV